MIALTLEDIERELTELADEISDDCEDWGFDAPERLRKLARRIAVHLATGGG